MSHPSKETSETPLSSEDFVTHGEILTDKEKRT